MRRPKVLSIGIICIFLPGVTYAGQIYGSLTSGGRAVANTVVSVDCGGGRISRGRTSADGSYQVNATGEGRCTLALPEKPGAWAFVFSYRSATHYDFELVQTGNAYELRSR